MYIFIRIFRYMMRNNRTNMKNIIFENYDNKTKEFVETELDLNQPTIDEFLTEANIQDEFTKVGDIVPDADLGPEYRVNILPFFKK